MEEEYIKRVEAYLSRRLSEGERVQFEAELNSDQVLKNIFDEYTLAMVVIDRQVENDLRLKFKTWRVENKRARSRTLVLWSSMAASLLLLITFFFIFSPPVSKSKQVALDVYTLPKSSGSTMGESDQHLSMGRQAYDNSDFQQAIVEWSTVTAPTPEVTYYLAHSYFNTKKYDEAASLFQRLASSSSVYNFPSDWYLALSYLARDNHEKGMQQLAKMVKDKDHPYHHEAQQLRAKLLTL